MTIAQKVRAKVKRIPVNVMFSAGDLRLAEENRGAVAKTLNRMVASGELKKIKNGRFYKPWMTEFGELSLSQSQIVKSFLEKDGKPIGYITGDASFNALLLTTQISWRIQIGTNRYRAPVTFGKYQIEFVKQANPITRDNIKILRILDAIRFVREIPGTSTNDACKRLLWIVKELSAEERQVLARNALAYTSYVRAVCGALLEKAQAEEELIALLKASLNSTTRYKLPISERVLENKKGWNIDATS